MWIDVGQLIRNHVSDKNGNTLPDNLTSGSYEFRDLTDPNVGSLFEGKVIYDKTYGHVAYGCANCCGYYTPYLTFNPLGIPFGDGAANGVDAIDNCGGFANNVSSSFYDTWTTANTNVATVDYKGYHSAVAMGATSSSTWGNLPLAGLRFTCPLSMRNPQGNDSVMVGVVFSTTPIVPLGKTVPITATVNPSTNTTPITLTLSTTSGTGSATFINGSKTMTIITTTTLNVVGVSASSAANNIKLAATVSSTQVASTTFTVTAPITGAIPVNFTQISSSIQPGTVLEFHYRWASSSGNMADLSACQVEEYVTYVGPSPFPWASPPYVPGVTSPNPTTGGGPTPGNLGTSNGIVDDQLHIAFQGPYKFNFVASNQLFQFQCPNYQGNAWTQLFPAGGTIPISRVVNYYTDSPTVWYYEVSKSGLDARANLP